MVDLNVPIDPIHAMATATVRKLNEAFQEAKSRVASWEPRAMPADWVPPRR